LSEEQKSCLIVDFAMAVAVVVVAVVVDAAAAAEDNNVGENTDKSIQADLSHMIDTDAAVVFDSCTVGVHPHYYMNWDCCTYTVEGRGSYMEQVLDLGPVGDIDTDFADLEVFEAEAAVVLEVGAGVAVEVGSAAGSIDAAVATDIVVVVVLVVAADVAADAFDAADVVFDVDFGFCYYTGTDKEGLVPAAAAILVARSDHMVAMHHFDFSEEILGSVALAYF